MSSTKEILIGPADGTIKEMLSQANPIDVIQKIQRDYGLEVRGMDVPYALLDLCGYTRFEIHLAYLDALNKTIVAKIKSASFQLADFQDIFDRTKKYIGLPYMQPIPMALLEKFEPHIGEDVLEDLKADEAVFNNCPLNIKKRIWKKDEVFFQQQMLAMLNDYHHDDTLKELAMTLKPDNYQEVLEKRRSHPIMMRIMEIIGGDATLYRMFTDLVRIVFKATPYPSLCSLRVDLLMNFHDQDATQIYESDKCHRLIWSLDTCVRNQNMDNAIVAKIKECFDDVKNGTPLYGDFAMVLMDPLISNFLSSSIVRWLRNGIDSKDATLDELINYNAKLLNLAQHAPSAIADEIKIPKLDKDLRTHFWQAMISWIINEKAGATVPSESVQAIHDLLVKNDVARKTFVQYLFERAGENDLKTLNLGLPLLLQTLPRDEGEIQHATTYKSFVFSLINDVIKRRIQDVVVDRRWRQTIMDHFLIKLIHWNAWAIEQVVRLIAALFADPKVAFNLSADHIALLTDWANQCAAQAMQEQDESSKPNLYNAFENMLSQAHQHLDESRQFEPATVIQFCTELA